MSSSARNNLKRKARVYIGTSGYQYDHWKGIFYPEKLPKPEWFRHYCRHFNSVEINNTFYNLPDESTFEKWREQAPAGFSCVLKFSRYGTHIKCLKDPEDTVSTFMNRAEHLGNRLGPILIQLRPGWSVNIERLRSFLEILPANRRWAFEFRNPDWLSDDVFDLLKKHNAALCIHDMLEHHPVEITADWVYLRFHGDHYSGSYSKAFLAARADQVAGYCAEGLDVYAFFNNDAEGHAVRNAMDLSKYITLILHKQKQEF